MAKGWATIGTVATSFHPQALPSIIGSEKLSLERELTHRNSFVGMAFALINNIYSMSVLQTSVYSCF